jgi:3-oxoacyl-[acyl-carrier-protein] synthase III
MRATAWGPPIICRGARLRFDELYIAGTGRWLPPAVSVADAVAQGLCDRATAAQAGIESVTVSDADAAPEMAARAAEIALDRSGCSRADIDLILHATAYYQGHDTWCAPSYIQRVAVGNHCPAIEVRQMSNAGMAAIELAAAYLTACPARSAGLLTAGDRFCLPGFDRWRSDPGTICADGGAALVLSRQSGFARLRSVVSVSEPGLEGMHRGDDPFGPAPFSHRQPVDMAAWKRAFTARSGMAYSVARVREGHREAVKRALADAETELTEIDWFVLPNLGQKRMSANYFAAFDIAPERTTWSWGRRVGHLGGADQFAGLHELAESGVMRPGDRLMLMGIGGGFTWTCACAEILARPGNAAPSAG